MAFCCANFSGVIVGFQDIVLSAEDAAALAADKAALKGALSSDILPKLNLPLNEHVVSSDAVMRQTAREVVVQFQKKVLPRSVHNMLRRARAVINAEGAGP